MSPSATSREGNGDPGSHHSSPAGPPSADGAVESFLRTTSDAFAPVFDKYTNGLPDGGGGGGSGGVSEAAQNISKLYCSTFGGSRMFFEISKWGCRNTVCTVFWMVLSGLEDILWWSFKLCKACWASAVRHVNERSRFPSGDPGWKKTEKPDTDLRAMAYTLHTP